MTKFNYKILLSGALIVALSACSSSNDSQMDTMDNQMYRIKITNLTNAQPLSPPVAMLHDSTFNFWTVGVIASVALERMAEGGDGSALLALYADNSQHAESAALVPGASTEFILEMTSATDNLLSVAGMLVNTNDAFSGLNSVALDELVAGQSRVYFTHAYDAGTEFNSELDGTTPGTGGGFDAARDDVTDVVTLHSGVVSNSDDFTDSILTEANKFDNPALRIEVFAL